MGWTQEEIQKLKLKEDAIEKDKANKVHRKSRGSHNSHRKNMSLNQQPQGPLNQPQQVQNQGFVNQGSQPGGQQAQSPQAHGPHQSSQGTHHQGPNPQGPSPPGPLAHPPHGPEQVLVVQNSEKLLAAFKPVWWFLLVMGQMPFRIIRKGSMEVPIYNFRFSTVSVQTIIYGITFLLFSFFYLLVTCGIFYFFFSGYTKIPKTDYPDPTSRMLVTVSLEKYETRAQLIPMLVIWSLMTITFMGFITVFVKGSKLVQYFNYWNSVVQIIDIDPTLGVRKYFIFQNLLSFGILIVFVAHFLWGFQKSSNGQGFKLAAQQANMVFGMFGSFKDVKNVNEQGILLFSCMLVVLSYGIIGSRVQIIPFLFYSQLLKNASQIWNERFRNLIRNSELTINKQTHRRVDYGSLLKDHLVLVQLFKMTENTFSISLIAFYFVNVKRIISITYIFPVYFLASILLRPLTDPIQFVVVKWDPSVTGDTEKGYYEVNETDSKIQPGPGFHAEDVNATEDQVVTFIIILILLGYQVITTYQVTAQATRAYEHAMTGFSILRKHGFMHCRNKTERNFIHTLVFSFARNNPMMITGGGYFPLNNTLIIAMVANLINFVVFMYQFKPDDWDDLEYNWDKGKQR